MYEQYFNLWLPSTLLYIPAVSKNTTPPNRTYRVDAAKFAAIAKKKPTPKSGLKSIFLEEIWRRQPDISIFMVQRNTYYRGPFNLMNLSVFTNADMEVVGRDIQDISDSTFVRPPTDTAGAPLWLGRQIIRCSVTFATASFSAE